MRFFGLAPDQILTRVPAAEIKPPVSATHAILYGGFSLGVVSVLAYSIWAFGVIRSDAVMYPTIAAVYIGGAGLALSRLVPGRGGAIRFALLFAAAFLLYAIAWCAFWFGLKSKFHGDLWGSAVGLAAMTWLIVRSFEHPGEFLPLFGVLFACHTFGYYLGDALHVIVRGPTGRLLWGAAYGVGFGAGVGYLLFRCQSPLQSQLRRDSSLQKQTISR